MTRTRNVPDPYEPVFLRRSKNGFVGLKGLAWTLMKTRREDTTLFADFIYVKLQLENLWHTFEDLSFQSLSFDESICVVHPILSPKKCIAMKKVVQEEESFVPVIWRRYVENDYVLSPTIKAFYNHEQLNYMPKLTWHNAKPEHVPFMFKADMDEYTARLQQDGDDITLVDVPEE